MSFLSSQYQPSNGDQSSSNRNQSLSVFQPTFFEIMTAQRMISGLKSALRYVLVMAAQRNFRYLHFVSYYDEYFAMLQTMIERHFLYNFDSSFAEHLFGLKRIDSKQFTVSEMNQHQGKTSFLTNKQRNESLLCLVLIPYLKDKLENYYIDLKRDDILSSSEGIDNDSLVVPYETPSASNRSNSNTWKIIKRYFVKLWPYISTIYEGSHFVFMFLYLLKSNFKYHNPFMYLIGLCLKRTSPNEHLQHMKLMYTKRNNLVNSFKQRGGIIFGSLLGYIVNILYSLSDYSTHLLLAIAFLFKFFEWYFSNESSLVPKGNIVIPSPPEQPERAVGGLEVPTNPRHCPICKKERRNSTLLTVSGFVFCYKCIQSHLQTHQKCPITHIACTSSHLVKIFEN
ncbi:hypothetical protein FDP41_003520 [Naegleria fowleri]|uniref:Peroxin-12 n=1 Tax=Naegleria fowleri TaxID=5763 RepID=A0A6A5BUC0_NAEFO|nr:Peroxin 12 (Pex12), putative [Naegleria fowleri]KAF0977528.1 hypothetical protein FDP41_003520 [Naegleria fowleri]